MSKKMYNYDLEGTKYCLYLALRSHFLSYGENCVFDIDTYKKATESLYGFGNENGFENDLLFLCSNGLCIVELGFFDEDGPDGLKVNIIYVQS